MSSPSKRRCLTAVEVICGVVIGPGVCTSLKLPADTSDTVTRVKKLSFFQRLMAGAQWHGQFSVMRQRAGLRDALTYSCMPGTHTHTCKCTPTHPYTVSLTDTLSYKCIRTHTHTHAYIHIVTQMHTHSLTPLHTHTHLSLSLSHIHTVIQMHIRTHTETWTVTQMYRYTVSHTQSRTETHTQRLKCTVASIPSHTVTQMHSCMHTLSHTHTHCLTHTQKHWLMETHTETHTVTQMHRCTHSDTNAHTTTQMHTQSCKKHSNILSHTITHTATQVHTHTHYTHWEWQKHPTDHQLWCVSRIAWRRPAWGWWDWSAPPPAPGSCGTSTAAATHRCGWPAARLPGTCRGSSGCQNVNARVNTGAPIEVSFPAVTLVRSYLSLIPYPSLIPCSQSAWTCAGPFILLIFWPCGDRVRCGYFLKRNLFGVFIYLNIGSFTVELVSFFFSIQSFCPVSGVSFYYSNRLFVLFIFFIYTVFLSYFTSVFAFFYLLHYCLVLLRECFFFYLVSLSCFTSVFL